jgi:4-carboxymuconolactone decarboxylase
MSTTAKNGGDHMTENSDFGTFGRYREVPVEHLAPELKAAYEFPLGMRGHLPGPSKIWLGNPRLLQTITPTGAYFQTESTLTKAEIEIEIATNLINGKWHAAYSNSEHEQIGHVAGGLAPHKVQTLIAGLPTSFDDPRQQVVYELSSALIGPRVVPQGLYQRARELLGDKGIVDVTVQLGWFTGLSLTSAAYDVPSHAAALIP